MHIIQNSVNIAVTNIISKTIDLNIVEITTKQQLNNNCLIPKLVSYYNTIRKKCSSLKNLNFP